MTPGQYLFTKTIAYSQKNLKPALKFHERKKYQSSYNLILSWTLYMPTQKEETQSDQKEREIQLTNYFRSTNPSPETEATWRITFGFETLMSLKMKSWFLTDNMCKVLERLGIGSLWKQGDYRGYVLEGVSMPNLGCQLDCTWSQLKLSSWASLWGTFLTGFFEVGRSTLNLGLIFWWQLT